MENLTEANKIYLSEDQTAKRMPSETPMTLLEVVEFVEKVTQSKWWLRHSKYLQVKIRDGRGTDDALTNFEHGALSLPHWARIRPVVIHELAHLITNIDAANHGPEFVANLVEMYRRFLGSRWSNILIQRLERNRIEWRGVRNRFTLIRPTYSVPKARKPLLITYR